MTSNIRITVFKESHHNHINTSYNNNNHKELFSIHPFTSTTSVPLNGSKDNNNSTFYKNARCPYSVNKNKTKILDFDKILDVLMGHKSCRHKRKSRHKKHPINNNKKFVSKKKTNIMTYSNNKLHKRKSDLYDINNFCSNTAKIVEKKEYVKIECPKFRELSECELCNECCECIYEDVSNERYYEYHYKCENEEIGYRLKINNSHLKKGSIYKKKENDLMFPDTKPSSVKSEDNVNNNKQLIIRIPLDE